LRAKLACECIALLSIERIGDAIDQVVIGLHAALLLELGEAQAGVGADAVQQGDAAACDVFGLRLHGPEIRGNLRAHRRLRHQRVLALVGLGLQRLGGEPRDARVQRHREIAGFAPRRPLPAQRLDPVPAIAVAVQHLAVQRGQQVREECFAVLSVRVRQSGAGHQQCRLRIRRQRRIRRQQHRLAQEHAQIFGECFVVRPQRTKIVGRGRFLCMQAPQVGGEFRAQVAFVGQQLRCVEAVARFQCVFAQHARAEAVDGEDGGEVDVQHGLAQATAQRVIAFFAAFAMQLQQLPGQPCFRAVVFVSRRVEQLQRQLQALADTLAQLLRRCFGEGDREDLADAQPALDHQPRHQRGKGVGLAGAGAGLDQAHAIQRQLEVRVADGAHASSSASSGKASTLMIGAGIGSPRVTAP